MNKLFKIIGALAITLLVLTVLIWVYALVLSNLGYKALSDSLEIPFIIALLSGVTLGGVAFVRFIIQEEL